MFETLRALPADPLLGIIERFAKDSNPSKIDLGVGIYKDENNQTPVLSCVKVAEKHLVETQNSKRYLGSAGDQVFTQHLLRLSLGVEHSAISDQRIAALQTPGGCGALRVAAELIMRADSQAKIWVSDPTWANHVPLLGDAGMEIVTYPYYDYDEKAIRFDDMLAALEKAQAGDMVLLHACCHNPCGADLSQDQWRKLLVVLQTRNLVPFIDMAYQGFGKSLEADAYGLRLLLNALPEAVFAVSCSKNFGLYRDRVGLVGFMASSANQARVTYSNLTQIVRGIYSMPPDHGAAVVAHILDSQRLRNQWESELSTMRDRINAMRQALNEGMQAEGFEQSFAFVERERGMFSFLGIRPEHVAEMASKHAIYMADSSRINVAGLNKGNIDYFCHALSSVLSS